MVENKCDTNAVNTEGQNGFVLACCNNNLPMIKYLLKCGYGSEENKMSIDEGFFMASSFGHVKVNNSFWYKDHP